MLPQPTLEIGTGERKRLDDLVGNGFGLIVYGPNAQHIASSIEPSMMGLPACRVVAVVPARFNLDRQRQVIAAGRDVDDVLSRTGGDADMILLMRPDRYVAAAAEVSDRGVDAFSASCRALVQSCGLPEVHNALAADEAGERAAGHRLA